MKILNIDNMIQAGYDSDLPGIEAHIMGLEEAASRLGEALAEHLEIRTGSMGATYEGESGICMDFLPGSVGQECPECINDGDPCGDWEFEA